MYGVAYNITGSDAALRALGNAQPKIRDKTVPVLAEIAKDLRKRARQNVKVSDPSNLFRSKGSGGQRLSPSYRTSRRGTYWYEVYTPSSQAGAKESMAEFAARGKSAQGSALVRGLSRVYGRPGGSGGGRILYKARDEMDSEIQNKIEEGLSKAASEIEKEANTVG